MKEEIKKQVICHINELSKIFNLDYLKTDEDKIRLARKLRKIDAEAHKFAEDCCNGVLDLTDEQHNKKTSEILDKVDFLLNFRKQNIPVFINGDPRGYSLKIGDSWARDKEIHHDWGGYGIIAPNFKGD